MSFLVNSYLENLWTPAQLGSSLALWLDADDASTITLVGGNVSQWRDKSGNNKHVGQATTANQPVFNGSGFNGRSSLVFDGASDFLSNSTSSLTTGTYSGDFNVAYIGTRLGNGGTVIQERTTNFIATSQIALSSGIWYISSDGTNASSNHIISNDSAALMGSSGFIAYHRHFSGVRDQIFVNGISLNVTAGTASSINGQANGFFIGRRSAGGHWNGMLSEILTLTNDLVAEDRQKLEGYLAHKWGLTSLLDVSHPYKTTPPTV